MDRQWRPSATSQGLSAVHMRPKIPSYTPPQFLLPEVRDPRRDFPVVEPLGSMWHDSQQRQHVHPEALGSPSGSVVPAGHRLLRPHPPLWTPLRRLWIRGGGCCTQGIRLGVGIQRFPNLLRWTVLACRLPYPGGPEECTGRWLPLRYLTWPSGNRFGDHVGRFEAAEFVLSLDKCSYYGPRTG